MTSSLLKRRELFHTGTLETERWAESGEERRGGWGREGLGLLLSRAEGAGGGGAGEGLRDG